MHPHKLKLWPPKSIAIVMFVLSALSVGVVVSACGGAASTPTSPTSTLAPVSGGQAVFARYCNSCHPGGKRGSGPSLIGEDNGEDNEAAMREIVRKGKKNMPAFGLSVISDEQLTELVGYILTLK